MIGSTLLSVNADLGAYFYLPRSYVLGTSSDETDGSLYSGGDEAYLYTAVTSTDLTCTLPRNTSYPRIDCFIPVLTQNLAPSQSAWLPIAPVPIPAQSACSPRRAPTSSSVSPLSIAPSSMCFGIAMAIWARALVVVGTGSNGRFFATFYAGPAGANGYAFNCTFGCSGADPASSSAESTFGNAVALWDDVLVVGEPGAEGGRGGAALFLAAGQPDGSGYGQHRQWLPAGRLSTDEPGVASSSAAGRLGAALSIGPSFIVAAAPGGGSVQGSVTVWAYQPPTGPGNLTLRALCTVARTTGAAAGGGSFGLSLAQSSAGPGWTAIAVGSPDENRVYMLWVSDAGLCQVGGPCGFLSSSPVAPPPPPERGRSRGRASARRARLPPGEPARTGCARARAAS